MATHIFYEVRDDSGSIWGGESAGKCLDFWLHNNPTQTQVWVSEWEGEGEELYPNTKGINITALALACMVGGRS